MSHIQSYASKNSPFPAYTKKSFNFDINDNGDLVVVGLPYMYVSAKNETNNSENGGFISYTDIPSGDSVTGSGFITSSYYRKNIDASFPSSLGSGLGYSVSLNAKGDRLATIASDDSTSTSDAEFLQNSFFHVFESGNHNDGSCNYPNFWQELSINNLLEYPHSAIRLNGSGDALITFRSAFAGWREFARELPDQIFKYEHLYNSCANTHGFYRTAIISETSEKIGLQKSLGQQVALSDNGTRILSTFNVPLVQCDGINHSGSYKQYAEVYNVDPETSTEYSIINVQSTSRVQCDENITQGDCLNNYLNSHWTSGVACEDLNYCLDDDCLQLGHPNCTTTTTTTPHPPPTTTATTTKEPFIYTTTTTTTTIAPTTTTTTTLDPNDPCSSAPQIPCGNSLSGTTFIRLPYHCYSWLVEDIGAVTFEWDGWFNAYGRPADHPHKLNRFQVVVDGVVIFDTGTLTDSTGYSGSTTLQKTVSQSDVWYVRYYSDKNNNETHYYSLKLSCGSDPTTTTTTTTTTAEPTTTTTTTTTDGPTTTTTTTTTLPTPPPDQYYGCNIAHHGQYNMQPTQCQRIIVELGEDIGQVHFKWDSRMEDLTSGGQPISGALPYYNRFYVKSGDDVIFDNNTLNNGAGLPSGEVYLDKTSASPTFWSVYVCKLSDTPYFATPSAPNALDYMSWYMDCPTPAVTTTTTTTTTTTLAPCTVLATGNPNGYLFECCGEFGAQDWKQIGDTVYSFYEDDQMSQLRNSLMLHSNGSGILTSAYYRDDRVGGVSSYAWDGQRWTKDKNDLSIPEVLDENGFPMRSLLGYGGIDTTTSGDYLIVGTVGSGAYVYEASGISWQAKGSGIYSELRTRDGFGTAVAINNAGTLIAVGARQASGSPMTDIPSHLRGQTYTQTVNGAVYIYDWNSSSSSWDQVGDRLVGDHYYSKFGYNLDLNTDGDILAVSAPAEYYSPSGYVAVYSRSGSNWSLKGNKIYGSGTSDGTGTGRLGESLSLNSLGDRLAIAAPDASYSGIQVTGVIYDPSTWTDDRLGYVAVYDWNGSDWSQVGNTITPKINLNLGRTRSSFGTAVKLNSAGNMLAILDADTQLHSAYILEGSGWNLVANPVDLSNSAYSSTGGQYGGLGYSDDGLIMALPNSKQTGPLYDNFGQPYFESYQGFSVWTTNDIVESTFCDNAGTYFYHDPSLTYSSGDVLRIQPIFLPPNDPSEPSYNATLKPNADDTVPYGSDWPIVGGPSSKYEAINNGVSSPDDTDYISNEVWQGQNSESLFLGLEDVPSDLGSVTTVSIKIRDKCDTTDPDACGTRLQIFKSDGTTPLTNQLTKSNKTGDITTSFTDKTYTFTVTGSTGKDAWDGALLKIEHFDDNGDDTIYYLSEVEVVITYVLSTGENIFSQQVCIKIVDRVSGVPCEDLDLQFLSVHSNCADCYDGKVISDPPTTTTTTTTTTIGPEGTTTTTTTGPPGSTGACCYIPAGTSNTICGEMSQSQCAALPNSTFYQGRTCDSVNCEDCDCGWDGNDFVTAGSDLPGSQVYCRFLQYFDAILIHEDVRYKTWEFDGTLPCGDEYYIRYKCDKTMPAPRTAHFPPDPHKWEIMEVRFPCLQNFQWERHSEEDESNTGFARYVGGCASPPTWKATASSINECNCCIS